MVISNLYSKFYIFIFCFITCSLLYGFIIDKLKINQLLGWFLILCFITLILEYVLVVSIFLRNPFDCYEEFEFLHSNDIVNIFNSKGKIIHGMLVNKIKEPSYEDDIILFSHGNSSSLPTVYHSDIIRQLSKYGSVFIYDYTGYGKNKSFPSEENCYDDIFSVWKYLTIEKKIKPSKICVVGHSLGCAISSKLVSTLCLNEKERNNGNNGNNGNLPKSLILICPFVNLSYICYESFWPLYYIFKGFDNLENLKILDGKVPVLISHIVNDHVIPYDHGIKLHKLTKSDFVCIQGLHGSPILNQEFEDFIYSNIKKL